MIRTCVAAGFLYLGLAAATPAIAQSSPLTGLTESQERVSGEIGALDRESVRTRREAITTELEQSESDERRELLRQQLVELDRAEDLLDRKDDPEPFPTLDPPFSLRDLDRTTQRLRVRRQRVETLEDAVRSAERHLDRATALLDDVRRRALDDPTARASVRLAKDRELLARLQLRNSQLELDIARSTVVELERLVSQKRRRLRVTESDLDERLAEFDARREEARGQREALDDTLDEARASLRELTRDDAAEFRIGSARERVETIERHIDMLETRIEALELAGEAWTLRYRLAAGLLESNADRSSAEETLAANLTDLIHRQDLVRADVERVRARIQQVEGLRERAAGGEEKWLDEQMASLTERLDFEQDLTAELSTRIASHRRYLDEFADGSVVGNVQQGVRAIGDTLASAWSFTVVTVDDRPITLGKIVIALALMLAGVFVSRILARLLRRRVLDRLSVDASLAASLQTVSLYVMVVLFFLTALRFVSIPLTALTFIGGALAIGVGFGSQNVVNNFISGLILMAERPIKVGDMIEVGGTYGKVERIGGRSTRVRSGNNTHVIVPNSTFLESEVLNWTLSDTTLRTYVDVGVQYGSPTREVQKLLIRAVEEHGQVLKNPEPEVLFMKFGDNSLEFRVYFWIKVRQILDRLRIQSDVRFKLDQLFRKAGIVVAFPQRDVHLDASEPVDVRVVQEEVGATDSTGDARAPGRGGVS